MRGLQTMLLPNFVKMLLLAFPQIYTRVFHLWHSVALDDAWVKYARLFICVFHSRIFARLAIRHSRVFGIGIPKLCLWGSLKMLFWPSTQSTQSYFTCGSLSIWTVLRLEILAHINFLFSCKFSRV